MLFCCTRPEAAGWETPVCYTDSRFVPSYVALNGDPITILLNHLSGICNTLVVCDISLHPDYSGARRIRTQCDILGGVCHVLLLYRLHYFDVL